MSINWNKLEKDMRDYMEKGANDSERTYQEVAKTIEDMYITEVTRNGRDQWGNPVISLVEGPFAATLTARFADNVGVTPKSDPAKMVSDAVSKASIATNPKLKDWDFVKEYISFAESTNNPQAININTDKYSSQDTGLYQINDVHLRVPGDGSRCRRQIDSIFSKWGVSPDADLDTKRQALYNPKLNEEVAHAIFNNYGLQAWSSRDKVIAAVLRDMPASVASVAPSVDIKVNKPLLPGETLPQEMSISVPQVFSKQDVDNQLRELYGLETLPAPPPVPSVSPRDLVELANPPKMPEIPDPTRVERELMSSLNVLYDEPPSLAELGIELEPVKVDSNLITMNATGMNGIIFTWYGGRMGIFSPPPGVAAITTNQIISPGSFVPMNCALGGADFVSETVRCLETHSKTVTGLIVGVTSTGSPITVPWVGIS